MSKKRDRSSFPKHFPPKTINPETWAANFKAQYPELDIEQEVMQAWFLEAIQAGYDDCSREKIARHLSEDDLKAMDIIRRAAKLLRESIKTLESPDSLAIEPETFDS